MEKQTWIEGKIWTWITFLGFLVCIGVAIYWYRSGLFQSVESLQTFVKQFGWIGIVLFILIQVIQVVIPIFPGGISCLVGVLLFGAWNGFVCNYVGICIGSLLAFGIAKNLGRPILYKLFSEKQIQKYESWTQKDKKFLKLFALAIFFPVAPDDFLCYLAGTTTMTWKQFGCVIFLGKPFAIAMYSLGLMTIFQQIFPIR